jgi:hypothetical protein
MSTGQKLKPLPGAGIEHVAFHDGAVGDMRLQAPNELDGQQVRPVRLTGVQLDGDFARHSLIDLGVELQQSVDTDVARKKHLRIALRSSSAGYAIQIAQGDSAQSDRTLLQKRATQHLLFHFSPSDDRPVVFQPLRVQPSSLTLKDRGLVAL